MGLMGCTGPHGFNRVLQRRCSTCGSGFLQFGGVGFLDAEIPDLTGKSDLEVSVAVVSMYSRLRWRSAAT